jgi:hypothetical protein
MATLFFMCIGLNKQKAACFGLDEHAAFGYVILVWREMSVDCYSLRLFS